MYFKHNLRMKITYTRICINLNIKIDIKFVLMFAGDQKKVNRIVENIHIYEKSKGVLNATSICKSDNQTEIMLDAIGPCKAKSRYVGSYWKEGHDVAT